MKGWEEGEEEEGYRKSTGKRGTPTPQSPPLGPFLIGNPTLEPGAWVQYGSWLHLSPGVVSLQEGFEAFSVSHLIQQLL